MMSHLSDIHSIRASNKSLSYPFFLSSFSLSLSLIHTHAMTRREWALLSGQEWRALFRSIACFWELRIQQLGLARAFGTGVVILPFGKDRWHTAKTEFDHLVQCDRCCAEWDREMDAFVAARHDRVNCAACPRLGRFEYELDRDADNSPRLYIPAELLPRDWDGYASLLVVLVDIQAAATRACLIRHILESDDYSVRDSQLARLVVPETPLCVRTHSLVNHFTHTCNCELCAFALAYCPLTQNDDCTNPPCTHGALVDYGRSTWSTLELAELESRSNVAAESKVKQLALRDWTQIRERDIDRLSKPTVMSWLDALFGVPLLQANDERIQSLTSRIQPECWANTWTCIADEDLLSLIDNTDTIRIGDKVYVPLRLGTARRLLYQLLLVLRSVND